MPGVSFLDFPAEIRQHVLFESIALDEIEAYIQREEYQRQCAITAENKRRYGSDYASYIYRIAVWNHVQRFFSAHFQATRQAFNHALDADIGAAIQLWNRKLAREREEFSCRCRDRVIQLLLTNLQDDTDFATIWYISNE
ncbi:uncharacterized protein PV09_08924 [Verruconis gallopava]|uniref:Uncharacterized protein n=1 Tax=Verruconis gallopava TaxID=253628 RepID=A0A0D1ZZ80_9PEZI|nr:uncharacterized protein PV09_08924 [Verruconis gallopava]KIV99379.1 hypothetical protein PV09_08924 [Verruconis gallopava]